MRAGDHGGGRRVLSGGAVGGSTGGRRSQWAGFTVVLLASFLVLIDISIVNVAIPAIQRALGAGYAEIELVVAGYQLSYAALLITGGRLGDRFGRRRIFVLGLAGFALASLLSGVSTSGVMLVGARVLQGLFAALLYPQVLSIIQVSFAPVERSKAFALQGIVIGAAVGIGPLLGGVLIQADVFGLGWRSIFLVNLPIAVVAIVAAYRLVDESRAPRPIRLDGPGVVLVSAGLAAVVFPLTLGRDFNWAPWIVGMLVGAAPLLIAFAWLERRRRQKEEPTLIELSLLTNAPFTGGLLATLAFYASLTSFSFTLSIFLQRGLRFSVLATGLIFIPFALGILAATYPAARLGDRAGKWAPIGGCGILAVGLLGLMTAVHAQPGRLDPLLLVPGLFVIGLGVRTVITPLFTLVLAATTGEETGSASGVLATIQRLGGAIGIAVAGLLFFGFWSRGAEAALEVSLLFNLGGAVAAGALLLLLPAGRPEQLAQSRERSAA